MHKLTTNTFLDMDYEYKCGGLSALYSMPSILGILYEVKLECLMFRPRPLVRPSVCLSVCELVSLAKAVVIVS